MNIHPTDAISTLISLAGGPKNEQQIREDIRSFGGRPVELHHLHIMLQYLMDNELVSDGSTTEEEPQVHRITRAGIETLREILEENPQPAIAEGRRRLATLKAHQSV